MKLSLVLTCGSASLVGKEGAPVKLDTDGTVIIGAAAGDEVIGILEVGGAGGAAVSVTVMGQPNCGVLVSGAVKRGQFVTVASTGITCTGGKTASSTFLGIFLENGVSGDYVPATLFPSVKAPA